VGNYTPRYFSLPSNVVPSYLEPYDRHNLRDIIVVSGRGGAEMFSTTNDANSVDRFIEYGSREKYFATLSMYAMSIEEKSQQVLSSYPKGSPQFARTMAALEEKPGDRVLFMRGLSQSTIPWQIHDARAKSVEDQSWAQQMVEYLKKRETELYNRLDDGDSIREICTEESIMNYVISGKYADDDPFLAHQARVISEPERRRHLRSIIERLDHYTNYELALVDENMLKQLGVNLSTWWMVKQNFGVLFEAWQNTLSLLPVQEEIDLAINDPALVNTLWEHIQRDIWEKLPKEAWNPQRVIMFLEEQILRIPPQS